MSNLENIKSFYYFCKSFYKHIYMRNVIFSIFILLIFSTIAYPQMWRRDRKELVFSLGATNFLGDLGGSEKIGSEPFSMRDLDWPATRPVGSVAYRYRLSKITSARGTLAFGYLRGDDSFSDNPIRKNRNINFRSPIFELSGQFELLTSQQREGHRYKLRGVRGWRHISFESYVFIGAGLAFINPQGKYLNGRWYNLKPLSTEGQGLVETRKPYSRFQPVIPVGAGFKYALNRDWAIGLEFGIRKTFSDYFDDTSTTYFDNDVIREERGEIAAYFADPSLGLIPTQTLPGEQRGDPTDKDSYMFATITLYYKLPRGFLSVPKFY